MAHAALTFGYESRTEAVIILYKTLPDDLLHRTGGAFLPSPVPNLHPETVARHAQAFASAQGLLGASSETVNRALLLEKCRRYAQRRPSRWGYVISRWTPACPQNSLLMHTPPFDGNRCRYGDGVDAGLPAA
ncbi:hypothetical protein KCP70_10245 [Salmonella enterica subsp. enterica]|nr:hypothetical protein KCP70_10245 [Salmonella enterica subsp. enterica]